MQSNNKIIIIMGVSGSGKTTIGKLLSLRLNIPYIEADDHHPPINIEKMRSGIPLTDEDRVPWLMSLNKAAIAALSAKGAVLSCSALKSTYRHQLCYNIESQVQLVLLKGDKTLIAHRLATRQHFMPSSLLNSQFDILEEPENAMIMNITDDPDEIVEELIRKIDH